MSEQNPDNPDDELPPIVGEESAEPEELTADGSSPRKSAVRSAARAAPLAEKKKALTQAAIQEGAVEVLLNSFSILREVVEDFKSSDKYFKYKAMVIATWFMLCMTSIGVSCSGQEKGNSFGARMVIAGQTQAERVYMIKNESDDTWKEVQVIVNDRYFVTATEVKPNGDITLSPRLMFDENGKEAPANLQINDIHVNCSEGESYVLKDGAVQ